jgi:hypothetical protein
MNRSQPTTSGEEASPSEQGALADALLGIWHVLEICLFCAPKVVADGHAAFPGRTQASGQA